MIPWLAKGLAISLLVSGVLYLAHLGGAIGKGWLVLGVLAAFGVVIGIGHLKRVTTKYRITRVRVAEQSGILNIKKEQARLEKITNITVNRDLWERILGIGRINIDTANDREDILDWWGIPNPNRVEALIDDLRLEAEESD